jgi:hypothetical protein
MCGLKAVTQTTIVFHEKAYRPNPRRRCSDVPRRFHDTECADKLLQLDDDDGSNRDAQQFQFVHHDKPRHRAEFELELDHHDGSIGGA